MKRLIQFFISRPVWGNALIAIIVMFGLFAIFTTKRSFFPELDPNRIIVSVFYAGASPDEMEEGVTIKIEQAIKGLDGIEEINSSSAENMATVDIKAYVDTDMDELLSDVENAINSINSFPQGAERPIINRLKSGGMGSVVAFVGISAKDSTISGPELTDMATKVERDLLNTKNITQITKNGFPEKEISVNVREDDLMKYGLTIQQVAQAISTKNIDITTGIIRGGVQEMNIRSNNRETEPVELGKIIVRTTGTGEAITVSDVADIVLGYSESSQEAEFNGKPAVSFQIEKTPEQDIAEISEVLHSYKDKFDKENPQFTFNIFFEFNSMLNERIDLLSKNGLQGLILVLIFLGLFLNLRLSAWVAFGIPFSFLGMFVLGMAYGITINMISLFGMILVVGILVDDGIVIAENIYSHYEKGKPAHRAALDGTLEVFTSVLSSVITTVVAFSILLFVEGLEMMREMAFVVIACLLFSLVEAFLVLPAHLGHKKVLSDGGEHSFSLQKGLIYFGVGLVMIFGGSFLIPNNPSFGTILFPFGLMLIGAIVLYVGFGKSPMESKVRGLADRGIKAFRDKIYMRTIEMIVGTRRKWYRLGFFFPMIFTFTIIFLLAKQVITFTFFPNIQPDFFTVEAAYKPGDNKSKTQEFVDVATQILFEENQRIIEETGDTMLTYFSSTIGFSQSLGQSGNHTGQLSVFFKAEDTQYPVDTLMDRMMRRIKSVPEGQLAEDMYIGGFNRFGKEVEIGLTSQSDASLHGAKELFKKELLKMNGVFNVKDNLPPGKNEIQIELKTEAELLGVTSGEILSQIRSGFFGQEAQRVIIGTDEVKIWVRYPQEDRQTLSDLENMKIKTMSGLAVPLSKVCTFKMGRAPESLKRRDGQRIVRVDAECTDPDLVAQINTSISENVIPKVTQAYPDVNTLRLGQFERSQKTGNSMQYVSIIGIAIMFIIIMLHFNNLSSAFLIMLTIPAGIAGAILGHGLIGIPVSLLSIFGMIALMGVLVNDSIVFLDRFNDLLLEGKSLKEAALEAAHSRFRAIILTSITTVAGLMPIISETSMQAQFLIPMATSIAFGVLFGTLFILLFYPSAIIFWNGYRRFIYRIKNGKRAECPEDVEPVIRNKKNAPDFE